MQIYLETVIGREDYAKEVKLYGLGPRLLNRYRDIFRRLYKEDRALTIRRDAWGFGLGLINTLVNLKLGLPSAAGNNSMEIVNDVAIGH